MKTSLSILAFIIGFACISQNEQEVNAVVIDSILKATEKIPTADEKVTSLSRATSKLRYGAGSLALIKKSEEISKKANLPKLLATTYYYYSNYYYYNTNLETY